MKTISRRAALTRESILRTALEIVDAEGLDSISMRRIGMALGVEAMSLYNHVPSKAAILDGVFETVLAELPTAKPRSTWQATLRERGRSLRAVLISHPNALPLFATRPAVTPGALAHLEHVLEALRSSGVSAERALSVLQVLSAYVVGHTVAAHAPERADATSRAAYAELDEAVFPRVREAARLLLHHDLEKEFEFGLEALVSGIEARISHR